MVVTSGDTTADSCKGGSSIDEALTTLGLDENEDVKSLIKTVQDAFADMKPLGITVQKVDGKWYVSPDRHLLRPRAGGLGALDKGELTDIIDGVKKVSESLSTEGIFSSARAPSEAPATPVRDRRPANASAALDACYAETEYRGLLGVHDRRDSTTARSRRRSWRRTTDSPSAASASLYFSGEVYSMSDEEFTAFAIGCRPVLPAVRRRWHRSTEFELPYELSRPDCLEGKNWYNIVDDAYTDRVFRVRHRASRAQLTASVSAASSVDSSTAPIDTCTIAGRVDDRHRRLLGHAEAGEHVAGVVAELGEGQSVLVDEIPGTTNRLPYQATPTNCTLPAHRLLAASTEGASWLQVVQVGAQNHNNTGLPA